MLYSTETHMAELCDICGDIGVLDAIVSCSHCKIAREHVYCRKASSQDVQAIWFCEACQMVSKESLPNLTVSNPSGMNRENTHGKHCRREKSVKAGKVKYLPTQEVLKLSSGVKIFESPSKSDKQSSSGAPKVVESKSSRTCIKPNAIPLKFTLLDVKPSENVPPRHGNMQTSSVVQQQIIQRSEDPKVRKAVQAPVMGHIHIGKPRDALFLVPSAETKDASTNEEYEVVCEASCASSSLTHFPAIISSRKSIYGKSGRDCTNVDSRNSKANNDDWNPDKYFRGPAQDSSWKGSFEIVDGISDKEVNVGFRAHPPSKVRRKVYEFSKKMPEVLQFEMLPRYNVWTSIFQDDSPGEDDIGLYFFSINSQRSANYFLLLDSIDRKDLVMRSFVDGVELLVFPSKLLSADSQRWNGEYFLWGIFHRLNKHKSVGKLSEKFPPLIQPSICPQDNDANGDYDVIDMEIDMLAGKDVGRVDIAVSREPSRSGCRISLEESPAVKGNMDCAIRQPFGRVKEELCNDFPPGFEETYRLRVHATALSQTGQ